jgi:multidrug efflux pump subunit AcrA (membrane-fusion protein)
MVSKTVACRCAWSGLVAAAVFTSTGVFGQGPATSAKIEAIALELTMPDRYQISEALEPIRKVTLIAPADGMVRAMEARLGSTVQESQEVAQLDRTEAAARLKVATAEVKEKEALVKSRTPQQEIYQAQLDAAQARAELAKLELDRCTLRAPFAGRITAVPVCTGQYVLKGTIIAELADLSSLKTLEVIDRRHVTTGSSLTVKVEDQEVSGKVQAIVPLPESYAALRELATPFAAAWVVVPNVRGELSPGLRIRSTNVPSTPIAAVAKRAIKHDEARGGESSMVQVIRNDLVVNVPVQVLGELGPERVQITGRLRVADALIISTSVPLLPGTFVKFGDGGAPRSSDSGANSQSGGLDAGLVSPGGVGGRSSPAATPRRGPVGSMPARPTRAGGSDAPF